MRTNLAEVQKILWAIRIDAAHERWHLANLAIPALEALADQTGEPRLREAAEQAVKTREFFEAARGALNSTMSLITAYEGLSPAAQPVGA